MNSAEAMTSLKRASSSGIRGAYCALTSTSGIVCTASAHFSCLQPAECQIRREEHDACNNGVLGVLEAVVEALVARAEAVADARDAEGPDRRADEGEQRVGSERHPEGARRNRDEGADDRSDPADEHADLPPPCEPALRACEALGGDVNLSPAVEADGPADDCAGEIAERAREREDDKGAGTEADVRAEERHMMRRREHARRDGSGVEHDEFAGGGEHRVDRHEHEDGVDALRGDVARDGRCEARDHRASLCAVKGAASETLPIEFTATRCT